MALATGSRRYRDDTSTVLLQARISREAREQFRAMAQASGLAHGLFLEALLKTIPVDRNGRPLALPDTNQHEELPLQSAS